MLYDPNWKPKQAAKPKKPRERKIRAKGLTKTEIKYMLKVLALLKEGKLVDRWKKDSAPSMVFNMGRIASYSDDPLVGYCGTVGCIGGWMMILNRLDRGMSIQQAVRVRQHSIKNGLNMGLMKKKVIVPLFYPPAAVMAIATPEDGIRAIENYLFRGYQTKPWNFLVRKL